MNKKGFSVILLILIIGLSLLGGVGAYYIQQYKPTTTTTLTATTTTTIVTTPVFPGTSISKRSNQSNKSLSLQQIENSSYDISSEGLYFSRGMFGIKDSNYNPRSVKLINGVYSYGPQHNRWKSGCTSDSTYLVSIAKDSYQGSLVAFGDLNNDGKKDAIVMLNLTFKEINTGGPHDYCLSSSSPWSSSVSLLIVFINKNGQPFQVDAYNLTHHFHCGGISSIKIDNGIIYVSCNVKDETITRSYKLVNDVLVKTNQSFISPSIPADWKTHVDNNLGISFKYPPKASININTYKNERTYKIVIANHISISVGNDSFKNCISPDWKMDIPTEIMINQMPFYKTSESDSAMGGLTGVITQYSTVKNNKCYQIRLNYTFYHDEEEKLPNILDGIVSTLKFIK